MVQHGPVYDTFRYAPAGDIQNAAAHGHAHVSHQFLGPSQRVRAEYNVAQAEQGMTHREGFFRKHIQPSPTNLASAEGICQRIVIHNRTPCGVDEKRRWFHQRQLMAANKITGPFRRWAVHGHDIGFMQKGFQRD